MSSTPSQLLGVQLPNNLNGLSAASSRASSEASLQRVKNLPGYTTPVFKGKEEQRAKVQADVVVKVMQSSISQSQ
jgi:glutamate dehydrogenase